MENIKTLANLHRATRADGLAIRGLNAEIAASVVDAQLECKVKKNRKAITDSVYSALRKEFGIADKMTIADIREMGKAAKDADKENAVSIKANKACKALAKRNENALIFMRAYNALSQAISRARKVAGLTAPAAATEADSGDDTGDDKGVRAADGADATPESIAKGLASLPASLLAEAVALLPASHKSAIALSLDA